MIKLEEGEQSLLIVRRHWFVMLPAIIATSLATVFPIIIFQVLSSGLLPLGHSITTYLAEFASRWSLFVYSLWLLILWVAFFVEWTDYYLDLWIVTDRRVIDIEQKGFFHREVTSFSFRQIQDITVETRGIIQTFFKFGTLHIQTAGHDRDILINSAENPEEVRTLVLNTQEKLVSI